MNVKRIFAYHPYARVSLLVFMTLTLSVGFMVSATRPASAAAQVVGHNPLLNVTADQGEVVDPDSAAAPPALCATYTSTPYANPAPNVDQIDGDTTVTVGTQTGCKTAQNETTIAVNPWNPRNLVAGANDYRLFNTRENRNDGSGYAYTTFDGGKTWKNIQLPHLTFQTGATGPLAIMDSAGDPAVSFGPNNTVYYANLVFSRAAVASGEAASGVVVSISHDGGKTWSEPSIVHLDGVDASGNAVPTEIFNDKEWIAVDPRDSNKAYITWTLFGTSGSPVVSSSTVDGGKTWSAPVQIPPTTFTPGGITTFDQGSNPQVDRSGNLYVAYEGAVCQTLLCQDQTDRDATIVAKSTDGGKTFTNTVVDTNYDFPLDPRTGRGGLTGENFRVNSYPQLTIDRATNFLAVTWADDRNGEYDSTTGRSIKTNSDAIVALSTNGKDWKQKFTVGTSADEFFPAVASLAGVSVVTFYTRAYDPTGINLDYAYSRFTALQTKDVTKIERITTQSENPQVQFVAANAQDPTQFLQGVFIGDYTAVAVGLDGKFHPCWTDFRGNPGVTLPNQDAYSQAISLFSK